MSANPSGSARRYFAITPHATNLLTAVTHAIYVGTAGDVAVVSPDGDTVVHKNMQAGVYYPIRAKQVLLAGTTAADLVGWYNP